MKCFLRVMIIILCTGCALQTYLYEGVELKVYKNPPDDAAPIFALDLSDRKENIPEIVYSLDSLIYLNLSNNDLKNLNPKICSLRSLKVLLLTGNERVSLPPCLFNMENLEILSLIGCKYNKLPKGLNKMKSLKKLSIMGNDFTEEELASLQKEMPNTKIFAYLD